MSLFVKICGITTPEATRAAVESGADAVGFVFAESPRRLTPHRATELACDLPEEIERVAVFLRPSHDEIDFVLDGFEADTVQADRPALDGFTRLPTLPVVRRAEHGLLGQRILFDSNHSGAGLRSDWVAAAALSQTSSLILAGGLNLENLAQAVQEVTPYGLDVSSGVEARRGVKDPDLIQEFVAEARRVEQEMVRT